MFKGIALKSDLNERFNNFIDNSYMETSKDLLAYRTFSINKMGVWNSDKPFPFFSKNFNPLSGNHIAAFVSQDNQPLMLKNVYLIRRDVNSIYTVPGNGFTHFPFYTDVADVMIGITDENQLVYIKDAELKKVKVTGKNILFKMNNINTNIISPKQLKDFLKI